MEKGEFGLRLRELRGQAGFSQRELADAVGVDFSYLSKIENGVMPAPSEEVIRRLAKVLDVDKDELLTLAGKMPSDIAQILKNREARQFPREDGSEKKTRAVNKRDSFNKRLRGLREQAGLNQRELADKIGVSFTYLSKIESGAKPPPSEKVILKLAEALNCDRDELMASAGRIPSDVARTLKSREVRQSLREGHTQKMMGPGDNRKGVSIMKYLMNGKRLARAALAIVLVGAVAASLWFAAPSQVAKALLIGITNPAGDPLEAGIVGQTYYFKVKVTIQEGEHLPIQNIGLSIFNSTNASSYTANLTNLPLTDGGSANYTNEQTGGGTVNITAAAANFGWRSGDGFVIWKGYAYYFPTSYGYGALTGTANMTYTIAWTPPASWPVGNYKVETKIIADSRTFTELSTEFPLQSGLLAETSISQGLSSNVTVAKVNIDRIKNLSDNSTATIPGGIGSYTATVSSNVSSAIQFLAVNGVSPFDSPSFNATTGVFSVANVTSPIQPSNTTVAEVVPILTGNTTTNLTLTIAFQIISAADQPGLNVPEEAANTIALLRGDADKNGMISIVDSLAIKQYLVSQLTLAQINPINAGSPKHDGAGGDIINVVDALAIEQFLVGQIGPYYQ